MNDTIHALLVSVDEVDAWERPHNFDYDGFWKELDALQPLIEQLLSEPLTYDRNVQDASFFTSLCSEPRMQSEKYLQSDWCIRFSNFGRFFTLIGAVVDDPTRQDQQQKLIALLELKGFRYLPEEDLSSPYDGVNPPYEDGLTWWIRYFDYL